MLAGFTPGLIHVWDMDSGAALQQIRTPEEVQGWDAVAFSSDGQSLLTASWRGHYSFFVWDRVTGQARSRKELITGSHYTPLVRFGQDHLAALVELNTVKLVDLKTGKVLASFRDQVNTTISCQAFSPGGRFLATGNESASALVWDLGSLLPAERPQEHQSHRQPGHQRPNTKPQTPYSVKPQTENQELISDTFFTLLKAAGIMGAILVLGFLGWWRIRGK
jgi:WD40 repeat protein